jgi:hypothetical protein
MIALLVLFLVCFAHALYSLRSGLTSPVLESHGFREGQTALTAYWLWRGGPWLAYETPVLGAPWSIPFEFPIYQGLVALLRGLGIPIALGGRLVAYVAFLGCLWPLWMLCRTLRFRPSTFLTVGALVLAAPTSLVWGRTVLIETTAVFFGIAWLACVGAFLDRPRLLMALGAFGLGSLGVLAKSTTLVGFAVVGALMTLARVYQLKKEDWRTIPLMVLALLGPFVVGAVWTLFAEAVRRQNEIGAMLSLRHLRFWTFGSLAQRLSASLWGDIILNRTIPDLLGYGGVIACVALGGLLLSRRHALAAAGCAAGCLTGFFVFTNLHIVHAYYLPAIALLALMSVGLAVSAIIESGHRAIGLAMLVAIVAGQLTFFRSVYAPRFAADHSRLETYRAGLLAREHTAPDEGIIVLGIDWSSEVAYYSERRSVTVPLWLPTRIKQRLFANPQAFLGSSRFGAVVACTWTRTDDLERAFVADRRLLGSADGCRVLSAQK